jgi:hypothetical protein
MTSNVKVIYFFRKNIMMTLIHRISQKRSLWSSHDDHNLWNFSKVVIMNLI